MAGATQVPPSALLLALLRVPRSGVGDVDLLRVWIRAVPDARTARDLVLPLIQCLALDLARLQGQLQLVLTVRVRGPCRPSAEDYPRFPGRTRKRLAQLLPAVGGLGRV